MSHLDELACVRYLDGELAPSRAADVEAHLGECIGCRELVTALKSESIVLREALIEADESLPASIRSARSGELSWALLSMAGLAACGVYTLWHWFLAPWWERLQTVGIDQETLLAVLLFRGALWEGWSTMYQTVTRGGTIIMSTLVVLWAVRWSWRWVKPSSELLMAALIGLLLLSPAAGAAVIETDVESYNLPRGQVIDNDLIVAAGTVRIEGTVRGDLIVVCQTLNVPGHVTGDILAFCQNVHVAGEVDGNVRSGSEFLDVSGRVGRNVSSAAETAQFNSGSVVDGGLILGAERFSLEGRVMRDVLAGAEASTVNGGIGGDLLLGAAHLNVGPLAEIQGRARYFGSDEPEVSAEANLARPLEVQRFERPPGYASPESYVKAFLRWAAAFVFGLTIFLLAPRLSGKVFKSVDRYGLSILVGAAALVAIPVVAVMVAITLVGLPVGLTVLFLYAAALYGGQIFVGAYLGKEILGPPASRSQMLGQLAFGLALVHVVGYVPYVGAVVSFVVLLWGFGALSLFAIQRVRPVATAS